MKRILLSLALSLASLTPSTAEAGPLRNGVRGVGRGVVAVGRFLRNRRPLARLAGLLRGCR